MQQIADWLQKLGMSEYAKSDLARDIGFGREDHLGRRVFVAHNTSKCLVIRLNRDSRVVVVVTTPGNASILASPTNHLVIPALNPLAVRLAAVGRKNVVAIMVGESTRTSITTAKALGLTVPDKLLALADEVIE